MPSDDRHASPSVIDAIEQFRARSVQQLNFGSGGGTSGGMDDDRIAALEKRFDRLEPKIDALVKDVAEVKGRISAMPSTWQLLGMILAIMGATFAAIRFGLAPH